MNNKKTAYLGLFAAVAIIFGYVESLFPFFAGIPGIKLGLANLAVLFILETYTWKEAAVVSAVRIVVIGFLFGNMFTIIYSLAGAALSLFVMTLMKKKLRLQHSRHQRGRRRVPQYRSADGSCLIVENTSLLYYAPVLLISGVVTGLLIGILTKEVTKRIHL